MSFATRSGCSLLDAFAHARSFDFRRASELEALTVRRGAQAIPAVVVEDMTIPTREASAIAESRGHLARGCPAVASPDRGNSVRCPAIISRISGGTIAGSRRRRRSKREGRAAATRVTKCPPIECPTPTTRSRANRSTTSERSCASCDQRYGGKGQLLRPWPRTSTASTRRFGSASATRSQHRPCKPVACTRRMGAPSPSHSHVAIVASATWISRREGCFRVTRSD